MTNFNIKKIQDTVWVFSNALENSKEVIDYFENYSEWKDWYSFGTVTDGSHASYKFNKFPTKEEWEFEMNKYYKENNLGNSIKKKIDLLFYETVSLYLQENKIELNNWIYEGWNIGKYSTTQNPNHEYVMHHHTDFQREIAYSPGVKFAVTAVFYLNDNYKGGEVEFRFVEDESLEVIKEDYTYKPSAGDVVVFLSGHPHYHGVRSILEGQKYIIRTYWRHDQPAHEKWLEKEKKYGKDLWAEMEKERLKACRFGPDKKMINNIEKFLGFEEYYSRLEGTTKQDIKDDII